MLEITGRSVPCKRCTNCSQQYCTADYTPRFDQIQAEDQAGFRSSHQTTDHLATYRMMHQKLPRVGNQNVGRDNRLHEGVSSPHKSIWDALKSCGIEHDYVHFLKKMYRDQKATVLTDEESDMFEIKKGTKQGDPLSSLLLQHGSAESIGRRLSTLVKEKRNVNLPERQRS